MSDRRSEFGHCLPALLGTIVLMSSCNTRDELPVHTLSDVPPAADWHTDVLVARPGESVEIVANAWDLEDETLDIYWQSGAGVAIAEGQSYTVELDSAGWHTVSYYAVDSAGQRSNQVPVAIAAGDVTRRDYALLLNGGGVNDTGRVKIPVDHPGFDVPGPAIDIGADDFTVEFWLLGGPDRNSQAHEECLPNAWIYGNIVLDRDRYGQGRAWGLSVLNGAVVFGMSDQDGEAFSLCGHRDILDEAWHHIAVTRDSENGNIAIYIDGIKDAERRGPRGDISYPDDGIPADYCDGPCLRSDPFLVIGAEKHDAGPRWLGFTGLIDELRFSSGLRYTGTFDVPGRPLPSDESTIALFRFDEGSGTAIIDSANPDQPRAAGFLAAGGDPHGPTWVELPEAGQ